MPNDIPAFPTFELFVRQLLVDNLAFLAALDLSDYQVSDFADLVGGDLAYDPTVMPCYIRINSLGGAKDRFAGDFIFDLEIFGPDWQETQSRAAAVEALLLGYPFVVEVDGQKMVFDTVFQNAGVSELPWDDDTTTRLGATFVITARRR